jgi:allophanate hydrolase
MSMEQPFDIASLHEAYAVGLAADVVIDQVYARIAAAEDPGIFLHLAEIGAVKAAAAALGPFDPVAKPLWGIPFAVKDNIDVAGMPTTAACPDYAYMPKTDATVVRLLRAAGALVIGKTNLDQFATGLVGVRTPFPVPRNAIDPKLVPGGSSSGSAVATARGIVSFALGTDTAGSGRIPAGLNNIVGLKPTVGALSTTGVIPACRTLDCVSIFALTVDDAWRVFEVTAQADPTDPYSRVVPATGYGAMPPVLKIGIPATADRQFFGDDAMAASYAETLSTLSAMGHQLVELPFADFYATANLLYEGAWVAERYAAIQPFFDEHETSLHPVTRQIYGSARTLSAADAFNGLYALQALKKRVEPLIASIDLLCVPTAPRHFTLAELAVEPIRENSRLGTYTNFVNLLDLCGTAMPTGTRTDGLPASLTLLAPAGKDGLVASLAFRLHERSGLKLGATAWALPEAEPARHDTPEDRIELVVVGAHLSGMPLNGELKAIGGRFLRATRTAATYRLFALAGTVPPKPGLLRISEAAGSPIEVEVWSLSPDAFGRFVAAIPAPLGIATLALEDGSSAKGFVVEASATRDALDITVYRGWRAYMQGTAA